MKRANYRHAIAWIAFNDGNGEEERLEIEHVMTQVTCLLVADIFGVDPTKVGRDVVLRRYKDDNEPDYIMRGE